MIQSQICIHIGVAYYLLYNGIIKDRSVHGNVLTTKVLEQLPLTKERELFTEPVAV